MTIIKGFDKEKPGLYFANFVIEVKDLLPEYLHLKVDKYSIYLDTRAEGVGYKYNARLVTNDAEDFIEPSDVIGKELT